MKIVCPKCGAKNKKDSKFCSRCGTPLACSTEQQPKSPASYPSHDFDTNRRWNRTSADFAKRFDVGDLKGVFQKSLTVEQGTKALILQGGAYRGTLPAGYYTFSSSLASRLPIKLDERISVILIDAADRPIPIAIAKNRLRTRDSIQVTLSCSITLRITDPLRFLENFLKSAERISIADIETRLAGLVELVVQSIVAPYSADELYGNKTLIAEIETALKTELNAKLDAFGLTAHELIGLGFDEEAWKQILASREHGAIETADAKTASETRMKLRGFENAEKVDTIIGDASIDTARQNAEYQRVSAELNHDLGLDQKRFDHQLAIEKQEFEEDLYEIQSLRDIQLNSRKKQLEMDRENERLIMENRSQVPVEVLISILDGNDQRAKEIARLELSKRAASLTPEQILAVQTADSPAAAEALKAKFSADEQKEFNVRTEQLYRENTANMKEVMNTALNAMGSTATARATAQNPGSTIIAGSLGTPVIISQQSGKKCQNCGKQVADDDIFCPECGTKIN